MVRRPSSSCGVRSSNCVLVQPGPFVLLIARHHPEEYEQHNATASENLSLTFTSSWVFTVGESQRKGHGVVIRKKNCTMLTTLPPELLVLIGHQLERQDLSVLIRTSKLLKAHLNVWLYRWDIERHINCLEWAAIKGDTALVQRVLDYCQPGDSLINACQVFLEWATEYDRDGIIKMLLSVSGVDATARLEAERTLLTVAGLYNACRVATLLLDTENIDINAQDEFGCTALWYATECGKEAVLRLLLERGAAPDTPDIDGQRPLIRAVTGSPTIVKMLLDTRNVRIHHLDIWRSPLHSLAASFRGSIGDEDYLEDEQGTITQELEHERNAVEVAGLLLQAGVDVNARTIQNDTALSLCIRESGKDPDHIALERQRSRCASGDFVEFLIQSGADVNMANQHGTPLFLAIKGDHERVVRLLLQNGADWSAKNEQDTTPLDLAVRKGFTKIVLHLIQAGAAAHLGQSVSILEQRPIGGSRSLRLVSEPSPNTDKAEDT